MAILEMSGEEAQVLREMLDEELTNLRVEVRRTDRQDYRDMLKARQRILERVAKDLARQEGVLTPAG